MPSVNQRTGRAFVKVNGNLFETMDGAKLMNIPGFERKPVVGTDVFGFTEGAAAPEIQAEFAHGSGLSVTDLYAIVDGTITFECDSGPVFILRNAWTAKVSDLTGGQGKLGVTFNGKKCEEQRS